MRSDYKSWLFGQKYSENTIAAQLHRVGKVEQYYGALDDIAARGSFDDLIAQLEYSASDERAHRPNPSRIVFDGNIRNNLQSYKNAVVRYRKFLEAEGQNVAGLGGGIDARPASSEILEADAAIDAKQKLSLERDMQAALRRDIQALELGLSIIDDGAERSVASGLIDILCKDRDGRMVVVELKAGKTDTRVVGQILGYMGDLLEEEPDQAIRGIIVAHEFDKRTRAAAKAVPNLDLFAYSVSFKFVRAE